MKQWLVYTNLYGSRYLIGIFKRLRDAKEVSEMYFGSKIEPYYE